METIEGLQLFPCTNNCRDFPELINSPQRWLTPGLLWTGDRGIDYIFLFLCYIKNKLNPSTRLTTEGVWPPFFN